MLIEQPLPALSTYRKAMGGNKLRAGAVVCHTFSPRGKLARKVHEK
jgi:hypothetical protein